MSRTIVQINFKIDMPTEEYQQMVGQVAGAISDVAGCLWKIWLMNEETREAGGIYLFESPEAAQAYVQGPIIAGLGGHPKVLDLSTRTFGYLEEATKVTRGPVTGAAPSRG
jgi:hypothetical protein